MTPVLYKFGDLRILRGEGEKCTLQQKYLNKFPHLAAPKAVKTAANHFFTVAFCSANTLPKYETLMWFAGPHWTSIAAFTFYHFEEQRTHHIFFATGLITISHNM